MGNILASKCKCDIPDSSNSKKSKNSNANSNASNSKKNASKASVMNAFKETFDIGTIPAKMVPKITNAAMNSSTQSTQSTKSNQTTKNNSEQAPTSSFSASSESSTSSSNSKASLPEPLQKVATVLEGIQKNPEKLKDIIPDIVTPILQAKLDPSELKQQGPIGEILGLSSFQSLIGDLKSRLTKPANAKNSVNSNVQQAPNQQAPNLPQASNQQAPNLPQASNQQSSNPQAGTGGAKKRSNQKRKYVKKGGSTPQGNPQQGNSPQDPPSPQAPQFINAPQQVAETNEGNPPQDPENANKPPQNAKKPPQNVVENAKKPQNADKSQEITQDMILKALEDPDIKEKIAAFVTDALPLIAKMIDIPDTIALGNRTIKIRAIFDHLTTDESTKENAKTIINQLLDLFQKTFPKLNGMNFQNLTKEQFDLLRNAITEILNVVNSDSFSNILSSLKSKSLLDKDIVDIISELKNNKDTLTKLINDKDVENAINKSFGIGTVRKMLEYKGLFGLFIQISNLFFQGGGRKRPQQRRKGPVQQHRNIPKVTKRKPRAKPRAS